MSFPRYERYKNSGVEWLGEVPEHWDRTKLRRIAVRYSGGTPDKTKLEYWDNGTIPWLSSGEVNQSLITQPSTFITEEAFKNSSAKWIPSGALVMALAGQGKTKGTVAQLAIPSTCNQSMAAIVPREMSQARFLFWWLSANYQNIRNMAGGDLRDGLNLELLGDIDCPLVPEGEGLIIARVLDQETAKIDALIEEQRQLIELLKEKRQAVISHAVTKGLNPDAPMKDSRFIELGKVPKHWKITPLGYFSRLHRGHDLTADQQEEGPYPVVTSGGITGSHSTYIAKGPGVVTGRYGSTGKLFYIEKNYWPHNTSLYVSDFFANDPRFVWYALQAINFESHSAKSAVPGIDRNDLHVLPVAVPPREEQATIVRQLDSLMQDFDRLSAESSKATELLQERRSALISAAVTGKIDVRNYTPKEAA